MQRRGNRVWQSAALSLIVAAVVTARAQHYPILQVPNSPQGIFTMMQDSQSALWLGTIDDVYRFDGEHFYSLREYGFPRETPNAFAEDGQGGIWIATQGTDLRGGTQSGGIYRYQAGHVEKIFSGDGLSTIASSPGIVLASVGTEVSGRPSFGDLVLFTNDRGKWTSTKLLEKQANHLTLDHQGNVLFPCPGGWCEINHSDLMHDLDPNHQVKISRYPGSPLIERVLRDRFGCLWFRAEAFASYQCPGDVKPQSISDTVSRYDSSAHLEEASDGSIFMLVPLALGRPGAFRTAITAEGLPADMDTAIVGKDGTIWIGTASGLYRFMYPFQLRLWDKTDGLSTIFSILRTGRDTIVSGEGIRKLREDSRRWDLIRDGPDTAGFLAAGPGETFFLSTADNVSQMDSNGHVLRSLPVHGRSMDRKLAASPEGQVWRAGSGVSDLITVNGRLELRPEIFSENSTSDIQYDAPHRTLWVCDGNDLAFLKDGKWGRVSQKDGLLNLPCRAIAVEPNGDLWLAYAGNPEPSWIRNPASGSPEVHNFARGLDQVIPNSTNQFIGLDRRGRIWRKSDSFYIGSSIAAKTDSWLRLDRSDGLDLSGTVDQPFAPAGDGSVWLASLDGVAHFSPPDDFATSFPTPMIFVAGFSLGGGAMIPQDMMTAVPYGTETVIHVGSLHFDRRNSLHLRYRLLPKQSAWIETNALDIPLGKLRWGRYTLQVQSELATGPWSPVLEQTLTIEGPLWLSWPLLLLYGVAGTGIGGGAAYWRRRRQLERGLTLPDLSAWRMSALSPETESLIGSRVDGRYEIGHVLSVGGFATVVRARDLDNDGRLCAVKIFRYEFGDRAWIRHRFEQEISALEQLSHPHIVRITGHGTIDTGAPYLVMEFVHGKTLREHLGAGALPRSQVGLFLRQIAGALDSLHQKAIYHRDLKPDNLMIRADVEGQPEMVLIDFSIAIVKSRDQTFHGISRVAGTLEYMAPEQVIGFADASTDIYALAKIIMEMLTGLRWSDLFPEATLELPEQLRQYFEKNPAMLRADSIDQIISAMAFDPAGRPKNVNRFVEPIVRDLEQIS